MTDMHAQFCLSLTEPISFFFFFLRLRPPPRSPLFPYPPLSRSPRRGGGARVGRGKTPSRGSGGGRVPRGKTPSRRSRGGRVQWRPRHERPTSSPADPTADSAQ